ncbi:MAG: hypothetical protein ORO03_08625 [Alphaproteobacteria bacterium]|nr:hypothetical protein [Alphaproteobacteria bacterium]
MEVRADLVNSNGVAYTAGSLSAAVSGTAYANGNNGQNASGFSTTLTGTTNTTLSIGSADASISISGAITKNVSALTGTNLGSFVFTAGQSEDIRLDQVTINLAGTLSTATINGAPGFNLLRNVSLYKVNGSSSVLVGSPNNYGLSSLVFNTNGLVVARNTSVTFNLTADVDSAIVTGATTYNVTAIANTTFVGNSSQTPGTKISSAVTSTITRASFAAPVLSGSELLAGYVIGGVNVSNAAAYTLRTNTGETRVDELEFTVIGSVSLIEELKVNGVPGVKDGNVIRFANNLNIPVTTTGAEILVNVKPTCFNGPACNSNSLNPNSFSLALTKIGSEQSTVSD